MRPVPGLRIRIRNEGELAPRCDYVLYWMVANRRLRYNFALQRAVEWCLALEKPLVIFEPLRVGYPHANDRLHRFMLEGMAEHLDALTESPALYLPYVESVPDAGKGLLEALAKHACVVVTDDFPAFFLPRMIDTASARLKVRVDQVDSNGLVPIAATPRVFGTAHSFRVWLSKNLGEHLQDFPAREPLSHLPALPRAKLPRAILREWPMASESTLRGDLSGFPIDHSIPPSPLHGGERPARRRLNLFVREKLPDYLQRRSDPGVDGTSKLSPYLHYGHVSTHEIVEAVARAEGIPRVTALRVESKPRRRAFFGLSESAETFLDELITWRELGFNYCGKRDDHERYEAIPDWARATLAKHAKDPRPHRYTAAQLERGETHDPYFNAAAKQLRAEGWFHNQARMIWGKRILEWSATPEAALETMSTLMARLSLDGRNPNSFVGFAWTLGKYDRPQGPERPIYGTIRPMPTHKERLRHARDYIEQWK